MMVHYLFIVSIFDAFYQHTKGINPRKEKLFEIDAGHVSSKTELYLNWADAILQEVLLPYWNALATKKYSVDIFFL